MTSASPSLPRTDSPALAVSLPTAYPAALLFVSGLAALVYQVLWIKQLSLVVGVEVHAIAAGISAFFAGLALGGLLFGRRADRLQRPVRLYCLLEVAVALLGIGATLALARSAEAFALLEAKAGLFAWALPFLLVGLPALLMGGTLPVLMRALTPADGQLGAAGGRLYAANTAGAIGGALLAPFLLIPLLGVQGSAFAAAGLNLLAALGAFALDRRTEARPVLAEAMPRSPQARLAILLYAVAGGIALGYEVLWSQSIVQFMSTRSFAFSVVLATYLAGLMLGSALYARRADRIRDPWGTFALLIGAAGLVALLEIALLGRWLVIAQTQAEALVLGLTGNDLAGMCARFAVAALSVVFVPTVLLGAAFPVVLRLTVDAGRVGRDVGRVVALNTFGGIFGTLLTGFVLVPWLGLVRSLALLALGAAAIALCAVWRGRGVSRNARRGAVALGLVTVLVAVATPVDRLALLLPAARNGQLTFYDEGRGATVAVVESRRGSSHFRRLYIQGVSNSGDAMPSLRYMRLQALLPLLIQREEPRSALVIGFGTGITAGALLRYPGLEQRVVAELLPSVVRAAPQFQGNFDAGSDPRLEVRLRDGRRELLRSTQRYDLITLEPPPPSAAGVVNLYSRDFYQLAARRLNAGGQVAQWLPLPTQNEADSRALVRSFLDVFPHASLWSTELHEMLLIGSFEPLELDVARIRQRFEQPEVASALRAVGVTSPAALLATWVTGRTGLERFAADAAAVTDDRPRIEYAPWVRRDELARVLPALLALREAPPLGNADEAFRIALADQRTRLERFYALGLYAYTGQRQAWVRTARQVLAEDGGNPYYRWFLGATP
ncbi:Polyamine aminopropyltransferase [compost metagenome]